MADFEPSAGNGQGGARSGAARLIAADEAIEARRVSQAGAAPGEPTSGAGSAAGLPHAGLLSPLSPSTPSTASPIPAAPSLPPAEVMPAAREGVPRVPFAPRQAYAAIDLGTNNCRLLIARAAGDQFMVIDAFSRVVRLGEGLSQTGRLSDAAMDRALGALHVCADKLRKRSVHLARSVATEACRRAANGEDFIARVHAETGIRLAIISAQEEARLAVMGCHFLLEQGQGPAMIFDIGGGSTELVLIDPTAGTPDILDWQSVPWGVVSLTEGVGRAGDDPAQRAAVYAEMRRRVSEAFAPFAARLRQRTLTPDGGSELRLLGTSGTVTTLASVHLELPHYDRQAVDGLVIPTAAMRAVSARLARLSPAERVALPCIGRERADLVVAGCAILEAILDIWPAERIGIADRGIREGILRSLIAADGVAERSRAMLGMLRHRVRPAQAD